MSKMKHYALIVEDHQDYIERIEARLRIIEHSYETVTTSRMAKERLRQNHYCYVILDLEIPEDEGGLPLIEAGEEIARLIKEDLPGQKPGVIICTNNTTHDKSMDFMTTGLADVVVQKETIKEKLIDRIKYIIDRKCSKSGCSAMLSEPRAKSVLVDITAGEFLLKSNRVDLRINDGEVIECVIQKYYPNVFPQKISRSYLFLSAIAEDNPASNKTKRQRKTICKRIGEIPDHGIHVLVEDNITIFANRFRTQLKKAIDKTVYSIDSNTVLPNAKTNAGYQLGDGFFITKVEDE